MNNPVKKYKIIFLGGQGSGKTKLFNRMNNKEFSFNESSKIGADFSSKTLVHNNRIVNIEMWDTPGNEKYRLLMPMYYRHADAAIFVFDLSNRKTFESLDRRISEMLPIQNTRKLVVGNKTDLLYMREVTYDEAALFCGSRDIIYMETSAKNDSNLLKRILQFIL